MGVKDITQKNYFTNDNRFAEFVNAVCFHGREIVKAEELISVPEGVRKADKEAILERTCDVVKKQTKDGAVYAIYVMENQDKIDYRMPIRVMVEEGLLYDGQIKRIATKNSKSSEHLTEDEFLCGFRKTDRLTPVYTIVIYWGDKEWDGAKTLREIVNIPVEDEEIRKEMLEMIPDYRIKVFDLNKENDFKAFGKTLKTVFEFYAAGKDKKLFQNYMDEHREEVESLDSESKFFLATMLGKKHLAKELSKKNQKEGNSMCKAIEDMIQDRLNEMMEKEREKTEYIIKKQQEEIEQLKAQLAALV